MIREARTEDAGCIGEIQVSSWQSAYRGLIPAEFLAALEAGRQAEKWRRILLEPETRVLVACEGERVVGFCSTIPSRDHDAGDSLEISALYLDPDCWRRGHGRRLCAAALCLARTRGCGSVTLWVLEDNLRARKFYESSGFHADGAVKSEVRAGFLLKEVRYRIDPGAFAHPSADSRRACYLGKVHHSDRPDLIELFTDPEARAFLGGPLSEEDAAGRARDLLGGSNSGAGEGSRVWAVRRTGDDAFIGLFWLEPHHEVRDHAVSYVLLPRHVGAGYASMALRQVLGHAFDDLKLQRVVAETQAANLRSILLLERVGMRPERSFQRFGTMQVLYSLDARDFPRTNPAGAGQ